MEPHCLSHRFIERGHSTDTEMNFTVPDLMSCVDNEMGNKGVWFTKGNTYAFSSKFAFLLHLIFIMDIQIIPTDDNLLFSWSSS